MRECGLKLDIHFLLFHIQLSLPMRECGLKPICWDMHRAQSQVTPHAGVWIETTQHISMPSKDFVTPHAGVWIETKWA